MAVSRMRSKKFAIKPHIWRNRPNSLVLQEIGVGNTLVMSDFRPGVEIWPFRACAVNTHYNPCYRNNLVVVQLLSRSTECVSSSMKNQLKAPSNRRNFAIYKEIWVADVRIFLPGQPKCAVKTQLEVATNAAKSPKYLFVYNNCNNFNYFSDSTKYQMTRYDVTVSIFYGSPTVA